MKLYDWAAAPNPRRVRIFLAEKGIEIPKEQVANGMELAADYKRRYPHAMVPMLELDDGTCLGECMAICRYLEELHPEPALMGRDAREKALVEMWERRAEFEGLHAVGEVFRNTAPDFAQRSLPGLGNSVPAIPALIERGKVRLAAFFKKFDAQLAENEYVAGANYSVADITALCSIDFASWIDTSIPEDCRHLQRWYAQVSARESAAA